MSDREWNHTDIMVAIARLEENQTGFHNDIAEIKQILNGVARSAERHEDRETIKWENVHERISTLESFRSRAVGAYLALTAVFTTVGIYLGFIKPS